MRLTKELLRDPSAAVRRDLLLSLRDVDPTLAKPLILTLAKQYDGKDRFYLEAIGIAVGHSDEARRELSLGDFNEEQEVLRRTSQRQLRRGLLLAHFDEQFPAWNDQVANLIWELRPAQVLPRLEKRLFDASTPPLQRSQIVDIIASSPDVSSGKTLLTVLEAGVPPEVRERILRNLKQSLPGKWRSLRQSLELSQTISRLFELPDTRTTALALVEAATRTDYIGKVSALAGDSKEPEGTRTAAVQTLGSLTGSDAVAALEALLKTGPLVLRTQVVQALGRQARPRFFRQQASPALRTLENLVKTRDEDPVLQQAAAAALAGTRPGCIWLLEAHAQKELPEALNSQVARLLRNSPYQDLRNQALIAFPPPPRLDPKRLPDISMLARRRGEPVHGKQLIAASSNNDMQCLKCHTIHGVGGNVGPDLSAIGSKASRENLFESILFPSKAIADQYITWVVETKPGLVVTGLLVEETANHITLRDANAKDTKIDKKEIETRVKSPESLMPNNLLGYMTEDELVDMVEYLLELKSEKK
jgi:putative heme-binding domain-containing protein